MKCVEASGSNILEDYESKYSARLGCTSEKVCVPTMWTPTIRLSAPRNFMQI